ncbi:hypothetical protein PHMEG_00028542 [Phytophthora megakarya]|uniref:Uncharacterized protein n=1 Tax=Phytophthora megakarya TaxID=4795 RepID=A0A225V492_9STRA|nr:hypothetical protein PHMEG_00028542 [Phytophthora megakarya]
MVRVPRSSDDSGFHRESQEEVQTSSDARSTTTSLNSRSADRQSDQSIGRKVGALPFIGCASHRFQLAVNRFPADHEPVLANNHALMKHLSTIKCRAALPPSSARHAQRNSLVEYLRHGTAVRQDLRCSSRFGSCYSS